MPGDPPDGGGLIARRVPLSNERTLVVRPTAPGDIEGLVALYEGLSDDDRYRRFFSLYRPNRSFFEGLATISARGGFGLVAAIETATDPAGRIVGEASYALLPNGSGELAITVATEWRGWLGPYLLDALIAAAAARGVPNIEADILATNRQMLALVRRRGYVASSHPDWSTVRVLVGTTSRTPSWPSDDDRARVLVETPGGRWHAEAEARAAGLQVLTCPGPTGNARCPALSGHPCPLAANADAIVIVPPVDDARWRALLEAHAQLHDGVPICVELPSGATGPVPKGAITSPREGAETAVVALVQRIASRERVDDDPDRVSPARHPPATRAET